MSRGGLGKHLGSHCLSMEFEGSGRGKFPQAAWPLRKVDEGSTVGASFDKKLANRCNGFFSRFRPGELGFGPPHTGDFLTACSFQSLQKKTLAFRGTRSDRGEALIWKVDRQGPMDCSCSIPSFVASRPETRFNKGKIKDRGKRKHSIGDPQVCTQG